MTPTFVFQSPRELTTIAPILMNEKTKDDLLFQLVPFASTEFPMMVWDQEDSFVGMQQVRGIEGAPANVAKTGWKRFTANPGYYGEFINLGETELTLLSAMGSWYGPVSIEQQVSKAQSQLIHREIVRMKYIIATLLTTGRFAVSTERGTVMHTDQFALQTYTASDWNTPGTATPLADFRAARQLGFSVGATFNRQAKAVMNSNTLMALQAVTTANEINSKLILGGNSAFTLEDENKILQSDDLPSIVVYDGGYLNDSGVRVRYIPDNVVVIIGAREDGSKLGEYKLTKNINSPTGKGSYSKVVYNQDNVPLTVQVHQGHNGGPVIYFPGSIIIMNV